MKKVPQNDDFESFASLFKDTKRIKSDKYLAPRASMTQKAESLHKRKQAMQTKQRNASFEFSDGFEAHFDGNQSMLFCRDERHRAQIKALRRGEYVPELILDLHGVNREDAKLELAAVIQEAYDKHHECINIIHGVSGGVLKQHVPNWLVQHPKVIGFHQAPLEWGGKGALLVLVATRRDEKPN
ncbi:endonuclease SmrB [Agaribacter flavus]|uniref:Endonuclease SmrB n=1 Tax=Agaribacter flavus TaxID=1902781 RepID=A0ABV7FJ59_9ALTE